MNQAFKNRVVHDKCSELCKDLADHILHKAPTRPMPQDFSKAARSITDACESEHRPIPEDSMERQFIFTRPI
ncbi:hypothetical protein AAVH_39497 [Aphelenchoides avenae]|nr:hypothetical protein AAVH_39497 [Aphelenchus avenae]